MKPLFKTLLRISAIGPAVPFIGYLILRTLWGVFGYSPSYPLWREILGRSLEGLTIVSLGLALFAIYSQRKAMPTPDKRFRIMTYVTVGVLLIGLMIGAISFPSLILGWCFLYTPLWMSGIELLALFIWLWMLSNRTGKETLAKPVAAITLCSGIIIVLFFVLMLIATVYVLIHGYVYGFRTFIIYRWIQILIPIFVIGSYAISIKRSNKVERLIIVLFWLTFAGSLFAITSSIFSNLFHFSRNEYSLRQTIYINEDIQSIVKDEMQKTIETTSPKWASALVMDVKTGQIVATYSSDSINRYRDTIEFGTLAMPLQLLDAIRYNHLDPNSQASISKEGITINGIHFKDSCPYDTIFDIPGIIAASSNMGAATLLSRCKYDIHQDILSGPTTMLDIVDEYCKIADDINHTEHDSSLTVVQQGLHKTVWDNRIGTGAVRSWRGIIVTYKAQSDSIHIAGKTGATQVYRDGERQAKEHRLSFIGYFPEEAPKCCCMVVLDTPSNYPVYDAGYDCGGTVRHIAEKIYKKH